MQNYRSCMLLDTQLENLHNLTSKILRRCYLYGLLRVLQRLSAAPTGKVAEIWYLELCCCNGETVKV